MMLDPTEKDVSRQALQLDTIGGFDKIYIDRLGRLSVPGPHVEVCEQRQRLIDSLAAGDVVFAAAADRLVRQTREFLDLLSVFEEKGAELVLLEEHFDTRSPAGRQGIKLLRTFAQLDFQYQSTRKKQGIQAARGQGRRIGRPPVPVPRAFRDICQRWSSGQISGREAARLAGLRSTSFYKKAGELGFKSPPRNSAHSKADQQRREI
jgi:DNA invertase Pin-like site-specific DNA recombinase